MESSSMVSGNLFIGAQLPGIKDAPEDEKKPKYQTSPLQVTIWRSMSSSQTTS